jgi:hypothetical protein
LLDAAIASGTPLTINFALPTGQQTINLLTPLPVVTGPLILSLDATQIVTVAFASPTAWNNDSLLTLTGVGTLQVNGGIEGMGNLAIDSGSNLTADRIIQGALVIGGSYGNPATLTIAASDASGNPLTPSATTSSEANGSSGPLAAFFVPRKASPATTSTPPTALATSLATSPISALATSPESSDKLIGGLRLADAPNDNIRLSSSIATAIVSSQTNPAAMASARISLAATGSRSLNPDAVATAFDESGAFEWLGSTSARQADITDIVQDSLESVNDDLADDLLIAIGKQWRS